MKMLHIFVESLLPRRVFCLFIHRFLIHYAPNIASSTDCKWKCISIKPEAMKLISPRPFLRPHAASIVTNCVSRLSSLPDFWVASLSFSLHTSQELQLVLIV